MKYLVILSLVGMVAYGQTTSATGKAAEFPAPKSTIFHNQNGTCTQVTKGIDSAEEHDVPCAKPKKSVKKETVRQSVQPHPGDPNLATVIPAKGDYSDKPENLPKLCGPKSVEQCIAGGVDKAAVPVEPLTITLMGRVAMDEAPYILGSIDGSKVVLLTNDEYLNLQKLRQVVVDEEKRLAVKYGLRIYPVAPFGCPDDNCVGKESDNPHYEFHGQFLLIEKAK